MATESKILLDSITTATPDSSWVYSEKDQGPGYLKSGDGVATALISVDSFSGNVKLQATLAQYPGDDDWFDIGDAEVAVQETTVAQSITFTGKFMWIRAAYYFWEGSILQVRYTF